MFFLSMHELNCLQRKENYLCLLFFKRFSFKDELKRI
jgi:hypothetical protein